jgi:hypothetical protein
MRRCAFALLLVATVVLPIGCTGDGVAYTHRERQENYRRSWDMDQRMLNDDLDFFMLRDQPSRLSRWSIE